MFNILIPLGAFLSASMGYLAIRAAMGLGIGLITYGSVGIVLETLFSLAQGHYNNIPVFALQLINLSGFGQAMGMVAAAVGFRATFMLMAKLGVIPK